MLNKKRHIFMLTFIAVSSLGLFGETADASLAKATACVVLIQSLRHELPKATSAEKTYILNSFGAKGEYILGQSLETITPNTSEGHMSPPHYSSGFNELQAAGRIKGIQDFMKLGEEEDSGKRKFVLLSSIQGRANILNFVERITGRTKQASSMSSMLAVGYTVMGSASTLLITTTPVLTPFFAPFAVSGVEALYGFMRSRSKPLTKTLNDIREKASNFKRSDWVLGSYNFEVMKMLVDVSMAAPADDSSLGIQDSYALTPKSLMFAFGWLAKWMGLDMKAAEKAIGINDRAWVGVDFLLTSDPQGEPELNIIMRGSHNSPPFPTKSTQKKNGNENARPELAPSLGLAGNPIPTAP